MYGSVFSQLKELRDAAFSLRQNAYDDLSTVLEQLKGIRPLSAEALWLRKRAHDEWCAASNTVRFMIRDTQSLPGQVKTAEEQRASAHAIFLEAKQCSDWVADKLAAAETAYQAALERLALAKLVANVAECEFISEKLVLTQLAGVPVEYHGNTHIVVEPHGVINFYFGGIGLPDGKYHGHYAMSASGEMLYRREPSALHGSHNFLRQRRVAELVPQR